jgi:hypothetical protein
MQNRERKDIVLPIVLGEKKEVCVWERERKKFVLICEYFKNIILTLILWEIIVANQEPPL